MELAEVARQDTHLRLHVQLPIDERGADLILGRRPIAHGLVIVGHRDGIIGRRGVNLMRRLVGRERPGRVAILQQQVANHDRVSHVARIVVRQPLQLGVSLISLLHLHVELVFLHRERLVDAQRILQLIEAVDGHAPQAGLI